MRVSAAFGYIRTLERPLPVRGSRRLGSANPGPAKRGRRSTASSTLPSDAEIARFDAREAGYARDEEPRDDIEAVSWQRLPETGEFWVYIPVKPNAEPGVGLPAANAEFPMLESYIDVVVEGGLEYRRRLRSRAVRETFDWSDYWLNDRELARRPWVHDPASSKVDDLLMREPGRGCETQVALIFRDAPDAITR